MNFTQRLSQIIREQDSLLCIGLDPDIRRIPAKMANSADPLYNFCSEIIERTLHTAAAYKLNLAFFESEGSKGWAALEKLIQIIPDTVLTIADAKRGDIGTSSEMYARAILDKLNFDAVTVNPYMGKDSVEPFLRQSDKGAFVLCLTSNPGNRDFQYFRDGDGAKTLHSHVAKTVLGWNQNENCGLVVGATQPEELQSIRKAAPELPFLIPGVGTQGGDLKAAVLNGTDASGGLALFNVSRGIIYKSSERDFAEAAKREAETLRDQINEFRKMKARS
ncbi:orotidine-5'-phosphate decarboxylase [candidate division KSB1 bacterium]|nr:orotidine-5'-phosphate decarboxylase [candidate division KSB1 bacterium]NIR68978.1 orotidine-5'-phosphate decarboxylase [candidate division KSB1 bacterium]NIS22600.1 orotidine-5'-phosphate decarboxylase [candidate division KSB1 bacterium]NIT69460.1 orotidine-5'-phosphate decarboxylase [candidate division KSB1 bacterium]NIU23115.1 orotidine-5'-phosphate decarboxylase [candidate division KSB1 bacterium]